MSYATNKPNAYLSGAGVRVSATFALAGVATDPVGVVLTVRDPGGTITTPSVVHDGLGQWHSDISPVVPGHWYYLWTSSNPISAQESEFRVNESQTLENG